MEDHGPGEAPTCPQGDAALTGAELRLLVFAAGTLVQRILASGVSLTFGRGEAATLRVDDPALSRVHLRVQMDGDDVVITDLGSSNGTFVHGDRLPPDAPRPITVGEVVTAGGATIVLQRGSEALSRAEMDAPDTAMGRVRGVADRVARSDIAVLLCGETGVGKEVMARRIHASSGRARGSFVAINCASLSDTLFESQLFGHVRGAFTGADRDRPGLLEAAHGGTVFLDEIAEIAVGLQSKLLRVLESREVVRVGGVTPIPLDVRFVSATNRDLRTALTEGTFRRDLYHRLAGVVLTLPPLRERPDEVLELARELAGRAAAEAPVVFTAEVEAWLLAQPWPGNVRELKNVLERAMVFAAGGPLCAEHLCADDGGPAVAHDEAAVVQRLSTKQQSERRRIIEALASCAGNQTRAAERLGIARRTLIKRIEAYAIPRPQKRPP